MGHQRALADPARATPPGRRRDPPQATCLASSPTPPRPTSAPNTWSTRRDYLHYPQRTRQPAGRSPPGSSRAPAGTWSPTGWTSPEHAGASPARKPCSGYEPYEPTATSTATGNSTSTENNNESTDLATPTTSSRSPRSHSNRAAPVLIGGRCWSSRSRSSAKSVVLNFQRNGRAVWL